MNFAAGPAATIFCGLWIFVFGNPRKISIIDLEEDVWSREKYCDQLPALATCNASVFECGNAFALERLCAEAYLIAR